MFSLAAHILKEKIKAALRRANVVSLKEMGLLLSSRLILSLLISKMDGCH